MAKTNEPVVEVESLFTPHKYQLELFKAWKRWNIAITCRGWGKTVAAVMKLHDSALNSKVPLTFAYIAPVKAQAWDVIFEVIEEFVAPLEEYGVLKVKASTMEIHYKNSGCRIKCYGADYPNNKVIRGKTFGGVVVDEFDSISYDVWYKIIRPCLRKHKDWALLIGTIEPGSNLISMRNKVLDDLTWQCKTYKFSECWSDLPAYDEDEYHSVMSQFADQPNVLAREYECDENATDDDVVIPAPLVEAAKGKHIPESVYSNLVKVMGVDVATGHGSDKSAICMRQGLACQPLLEFNEDNMRMADIVATYIDKWQPDAVFIDKGRGEGVISRLRQLGYTVIGVDFGGSAIRKDLYKNKRTEMYFGIKDWLESGGALPPDDILCQELKVATLLPGEHMMMERKQKIKEKLGRSPDKGDSLALTFAAPVRAQGSMNHRAKTVASTGYRPLQQFGRKRHGLFR